MLDSSVARDSEKCRPNMYQAIQWARTAWDEVTADTIKNCWNKVKIMPVPVVVAGGGTKDDVLDELRALLVSMGEECDVLTFVDQPDERWTEAPIKSDEEDAELVSVLKAHSEQDVEEADYSPASGILPTWTGYGKTVCTCLNMVQTCLYMYIQVHEFMNVYVHVMYMYMM